MHREKCKVFMRIGEERATDGMTPCKACFTGADRRPGPVHGRGALNRSGLGAAGSIKGYPGVKPDETRHGILAPPLLRGRFSPARSGEALRLSADVLGSDTAAARRLKPVDAIGGNGGGLPFLWGES